MIKAHEIRIGNKVQFNDPNTKNSGVGTIDGIRVEENKEGYYSIPENSLFSAINEKNVSGVLLTKEWLVKFGFEIQENTPFYPMVARRKDGFNVFVDDGYLYFASGVKRVKITSVHQLQNLYFAIFGEEIKLK